jgi:hypothetical protein
VVENKYFAATFNYQEPDYIDRDAGSAHNINRSPVIPMYFSEFSNLEFPRFVDRGKKDFGIGARVLITIPIDSGNTQYMSTGLTNNLTSGYSYHTNGEIETSNAFNDKFCRACFIHYNFCTIPKSSVPDDTDWSSLSSSDIDTIYNSRVKLSAGTYNGTEVFLDPNLSFNDVYLSQANIDDGHDSKIDFRGLYHSFYNKMVNQLKQKPRIRHIYLNLSQKDVATLDYRNLVFLDGVYYRLNKIVDYKPHLKQSTKVELVEYFDLGKESVLSGDKFNWETVNDKF